MKIHSFSMTVQDLPDPTDKKKKRKFAGIFGSIKINLEEPVLDEKGKPEVDGDGNPLTTFDKINFVLPLRRNPEVKKVIQEMVIEALTLRGMKVAEEDGELSHYMEWVTGKKDKKAKKSDAKVRAAKAKKKVKK